MNTDGISTSTNSQTRQSANGRTRVHFLFQAAIAVVGCALIGLITFRGVADQPVLSIVSLGSNQFSITVTNAGTPTNYTLFWKPVLADTNYPWQVIATNAVGQTNVIVDAGDWPKGFFQILVGIDQDGDGVPEWMDANPLDPSIGALSVTIDSPTNGEVLN